jgi:hypothetical protein
MPISLVYPSSSATLRFSIFSCIFRSSNVALSITPAPKAPVRVFGRSTSLLLSLVIFDVLAVGAVPPRARSLNPLNIEDENDMLVFTAVVYKEAV